MSRRARTAPPPPLREAKARRAGTASRPPLREPVIRRPTAAPRPPLHEPPTHRLRVNPIACEAHGMCAELLPELISLDEWGYPILADAPLSRELLAHAQRAAQACPTFALLVERRSDHR